MTSVRSASAWGFALLVISAPATAQTIRTFVDPNHIYSVEIPPDWIQSQDSPGVTRFTDPGGMPNGSMFFALKQAAGSLDDEINKIINPGKDRDPFEGMYSRSRTLRGMPCELSVDSGDAGLLACQFTVPYADGPRKMAFILGGSADAAHFVGLKATFEYTLETLQWAKEIKP